MTRTLSVLLALVLSSPAWAGSWGKADGAWGKESAHASAATGEVAVGKHLAVGAPVVVGDLAVYPVLDREAAMRPELDAVPLADAMAHGAVEVRELHDGQVARVALVNHSDEPVFAMAGDVIDGGMQDRVITEPVLVAAGARVAVPVHCVEQGRWSGERRTFAYGGRIEPAIRDVVRRASSQDATWSAVARANTARGVAGSASWLAGAGVDAEGAQALESALRRRFEDDKRVVGVVVARGGAFEAPEVYAHPALFARDRGNVLQSHLIAAQRRAPEAGVRVASAPSVEDAAAYLVAALVD